MRRRDSDRHRNPQRLLLLLAIGLILSIPNATLAMPVEFDEISMGYQDRARVNPGAGSFPSHGGSNTDLNNIEGNLGSDYGMPSSMGSLADNSDHQDSLVSRTVTEPATMLLLGFGLIGLAIIGRKNLVKT